MRCDRCRTILSRMDSIQWLEGGQVLVIGYCPGCEREESMTTPFLPVMIDDPGYHDDNTCLVFTTPGDAGHVVEFRALVQERLLLGLGWQHHDAPVPVYRLNRLFRMEAVARGCVPVNRHMFFYVMQRWEQSVYV